MESKVAGAVSLTVPTHAVTVVREIVLELDEQDSIRRTLESLQAATAPLVYLVIPIVVFQPASPFLSPSIAA